MSQYPDNTEADVSREADTFLGYSDTQPEDMSRKSINNYDASDVPAFFGHTHNEEVSNKPQPPATKLFRSWFVLVLIFLYSILAILAWVVTCILSLRPISGPKGYRVEYSLETSLYNGFANDGSIHRAYVKSEELYRAARVIQSIVGVLTIPLTSAVCSSAAVIFMQQHRSASRLTLRQVMQLADRGWVGPSTLGRAITSWKRYGSSFLLVAILLTILGGIISPIQQIFLSTKIIKTPIFAQKNSGLIDIPDQWNSLLKDRYNLVTLIARNSLMSATNIEPQSQLWQGGSSCNTTTSGGDSLSAICGVGNNLGNITSLKDPFFAQLSNGYSTGLIRQYLPRINSTAKYENISTKDYPTGCKQLTGAFYVDYTYVLDASSFYPSGWNIEVCMPADMSTSPWKPIRDRQDFTETLYLNISLYGVVGTTDTPSGGSMFRITVDTTGGYFELPNYMNGQSVGPLLTTIPPRLCGEGTDCLPEGWASTSNGTVYQIFDADTLEDSTFQNSKRDSTSTYFYNSTEANGTLAAEVVANKGPLLTTALALFGSDSFLAQRTAHPEAYKGINWTYVAKTGGKTDPANVGACMDLFPMGLLFVPVNGTSLDIHQQGSSCISNTDYGSNGEDSLGNVMASWIDEFRGSTERLSNVFTAAAFLANQAWIMNDAISAGHLEIYYDYGADSQVPTISHIGIIIVSILLGIYLLCLFIIALYASLSPRWTAQLDSFAMMKIGAAMSDNISLLITERKHQMDILDEAPGWIGDVAGEHEEVGRLGLGARKRLDPKRMYECDAGAE